MGEFKEVPQTFKVNKMIEFWANLVQNLDEDCHDSDLFLPAAINISRDRVEALIRAACTEEEIKQMGEVPMRRFRLDLGDGTEDMLQAFWNAPKMRRKCKAVLRAVHKEILRGLARKQGPDALEQRLAELQRVLKLSDLEREVLVFAYMLSETCLSYPRRVDVSERPLFFAMALDRAYGEVLGAMGPKGRLHRFHLLDNDWDFNARAYGAYLCGTENEAFERRFYKCREQAEVLPWDFFGELATDHGETLTKMLAANRTAAATGRGRMNILLYGAPGTGKTSFARALARKAGLTPYEIMQGDENGKNMTAEARMVGIQLCNEQVEAEESVMIVDEADELLRGNAGFSFFGFELDGKSTEKGIMNSILDELKVPAIWISNAAPERMDESVRRRFDYSICFEKLNTCQREAIWNNGIEKLGLGGLIPAETVPALAQKYLASAGGITLVLENLKKLAPAADEVESTIARLMKQHCQLMQTAACGKFVPAKDYSLKGLSIKGPVKLDRIVTSVRNYMKDAGAGIDRPRMNLLLWGPPGSGKTEFVKYLGEQTGQRVLVKKGSDILGMFVGQSEANIRKAFREAEAEHAILFFDEIDGLLQDRANAHASWEVTQVNELLQQMEEFDGVMVAATNFFKNLDPAVLRRFTFKLEFDFLEPAGKRHFFEHMFRTTLTDDEADELDAIPNLCPGDFRTVRQSLYYLGGEVTNADRLAALRAESEAKPKTFSSAPMGF